MFLRFYFTLAYIAVCAVADNSSIEKFIKLTFGVSKASYLPIETGRFLQNGQIMENPSFSSSQDAPEDDKHACSIGGWTAKSHEINETEVTCYLEYTFFDNIHVCMPPWLTI